MRPRRHTYTDGWKQYPFCCLGHHLQGVIAAIALLSGVLVWMLAASIWTVLYISYQALSVIRKKDSAGLDVADYTVGLGIGILVYLLASLL